MLNTSNKGTMSNVAASKKTQRQTKHWMFEGTICVAAQEPDRPNESEATRKRDDDEERLATSGKR